MEPSGFNFNQVRQNNNTKASNQYVNLRYNVLSFTVLKGFTMTTGKVKWFNNAKGFGFILSDDANEDLFAHYSSIKMDGYKTLKAGQTVSFDIVRGDKGLHATNIQLVETEPSTEPSKQTTRQDDDHLEPV